MQLSLYALGPNVINPVEGKRFSLVNHYSHGQILRLSPFQLDSLAAIVGSLLSSKSAGEKSYDEVLIQAETGYRGLEDTGTDGGFNPHAH